MQVSDKVYKPRQPQKTAPYKIFNLYYGEFKNVYEEKYQKKYGFFRPIIDEEVSKYLKCGIPDYGFARIACTNKDCKRGMILPFSCKSKICPSCMTKRMLEFQNFVIENIIRRVPHRHLCFTLPKILRGGFIRNRKSLNDLSRLAWASIKEFMQKTLKKDGVPGAIIKISTHGNYANTMPHLHIISSDGIYGDSGTFYMMPRYSDKAKQCLQKIFEKKVEDYCLENKMATKDNMYRIMHQQRYTGFSVYIDTDIYYTPNNTKEEEKMKQMLRYVNKSFYSMERVIYNDGASKVLYKGEYQPNLKRNFEYFSFTDFIAAITSHVPERHQKYILYYGAYSNKTRGMQKKAAGEGKNINDDIETEEPTKGQKRFKKTWAMLIKQVYEVDPLICTRCGCMMKVISIIKEASVIKKILEHLGLWEDKEKNKSPPETPVKINDISYEPYQDDWGDGEAVNF